MIRAQVIVRPRASIFDPQGDAVRRAVVSQGLAQVTQVHIGKYIELELDEVRVETIRPALETLCRDLLSNPVIEDFDLQLQAIEPKLPVVAETKRLTSLKAHPRSPLAARRLPLSMIKKNPAVTKKPVASTTKAAPAKVAASTKATAPTKVAARSKAAAPTKTAAKKAVKPAPKAMQKPTAKKAAPIKKVAAKKPAAKAGTKKKS